MLTKNQAFLVYKLGLALGFSTEWSDYVAEFGSVLGAGFIFRQAARTLVGLIPFWGIVPKVTVAYSGTYLVGSVVLQWYLMDRHITKKQVRQLYASAYAHGREFAANIWGHRPRIRSMPRLPRLRLPSPRKKVLSDVHQEQNTGGIVCPECGYLNPPHAEFCEQCKIALQEIPIPDKE